MTFNKKILPVCLCVVAMLFAACFHDEKHGSVVATVNGEDILLAELEARYDFDHFAGFETELASAEDLQKQYGDALASLIIYVMAEQDLAKHNLKVTTEELSIAEAEIKEDYPAGEFEKILEEDAIDITMWRRFLYHRVSLQKLLQRVIRANIKITSEECSLYYNQHLKNFKLPPRVHFFVIKEANKATLTKALESYKQNKTIKDLDAAANTVRIREVRVRADRLSPDWSRTLAGLKEGDASIIKPDEEGYQFLILADKQTEKTLPPSEAYPLVEKEILESKLEKEFDLWLKKQTEVASIKVSAPLVNAWFKKPLQKNKNSSRNKTVKDNFAEHYEEGWANSTDDQNGEALGNDTAGKHSTLPTD